MIVRFENLQPVKCWIPMARIIGPVALNNNTLNKSVSLKSSPFLISTEHPNTQPIKPEIYHRVAQKIKPISLSSQSFKQMVALGDAVLSQSQIDITLHYLVCVLFT
jgi:hypothetical protein